MERAIGERIIEITVFSAVIFLVVLLFRWLLKRWLSPRMRYLLWFLVILRLLVPFTWDGGFHLITLSENVPEAVALQSPVPASSAPPSGDLQVEGQVDPPPRDEALPVVPQQTPEAAKPQPKPLSLLQWLLLAWGAGAVLVLVAHACMAVRLNRRIRALGALPGGDVQHLYERARETLGIRRTLSVWLLPDIDSPALTAELCPKLLLPNDLIEGRPQEDKLFSFLHELMHYKRGDHLVCLLLTLLRAIWWFNPVVWLLPQPMRADMEAACDAQVVHKMDKQQKLSYANLLLELGQEE